ncbi:RHS repeat-associated core domain-containing protein [Crocinitomix algicola]|uniref:RHS repeat-associated core domain-containing protein n=1 Tax=Crocinitomix algicola TaxID=1740263 RepID=UPI0008722C49|nr:RHS repeat-associated core domain-containing protein [Crocinitomix algicola]
MSDKGNVMSTYTLTDNETETYKELTLTERSIYGSSRLGLESPELMVLASYDPEFDLEDMTYNQVIGDKMYELSNHLGNVLQVVTDRKLQVQLPDSEPGAEPLEGGVVDYYIADVVSQSDYYPFGMMLPNRNDNTPEYRYGFNGMEKDDEVKEIAGSEYTTEYRQYDPRIGRWTSLDPHMSRYPNQSPYVAYNNNPIYFIDPNGADGIATVDKENKTITVKQKFYYDTSDPNMKSQAIIEDRTFTSGYFAGETFKAEVTKMAESGFEKKDWIITDDDGVEWTVSFDIGFIGLETMEDVDKALADDPTANKLVYDPTLANAGEWRMKTTANGGARELALGAGRRQDQDGTTAIHEGGHGLGLPHSNEIAGSPLYGKGNGLGLDDGVYGIMSYAKQREVKDYEVAFIVQGAINLANSVNDNVVKVHITGFVDKRTEKFKEYPSTHDRIIE